MNALLSLLPKIFPISILMAVLLVFTRMANDRELIIMEGAGVSKAFQMKIVRNFVILDITKAEISKLRLFTNVAPSFISLTKHF